VTDQPYQVIPDEQRPSSDPHDAHEWGGYAPDDGTGFWCSGIVPGQPSAEPTVPVPVALIERIAARPSGDEDGLQELIALLPSAG
jgi:hypothetical protein